MLVEKHVRKVLSKKSDNKQKKKKKNRRKRIPKKKYSLTVILSASLGRLCVQNVTLENGMGVLHRGHPTSMVPVPHNIY